MNTFLVRRTKYKERILKETPGRSFSLCFPFYLHYHLSKCILSISGNWPRPSPPCQSIFDCLGQEIRPSDGTWICSGRLVLMVSSSSLVGFSLHMSTSSRSMSPLIRRPLATRPTRVTPQSNGALSHLRPATHTDAVRTGSFRSTISCYFWMIEEKLGCFKLLSSRQAIAHLLETLSKKKKIKENQTLQIWNSSNRVLKQIKGHKNHILKVDLLTLDSYQELMHASHSWCTAVMIYRPHNTLEKI